MKTALKAPLLCLVWLLGWTLAPAAALAQKSEPPISDDVQAMIDLLRSDFNEDKIATLNQVLRLTGPEAEKFWPIYRRYEAELAAVGDRKLALIREFTGAHFRGTLDNKTADAIASKWLKNTQERLNLWKKYHKKIAKAVSPLRAGQFLQVEHQLALFLDLTIASEMPQVGTPPPGS